MEQNEYTNRKAPLFQALSEYCAADAYPFHMPGHKRRLGHLAEPYGFDITEIDGFDNLHHAEGILLEAQKRAAALTGAEESFFLVNGSTCGLLAAVAAAAATVRSQSKKTQEATEMTDAAEKTQGILMARNCHKAVYHAVYLNRLQPVYLWPSAFDAAGMYPYINGRITPGQVAGALDAAPQTKIVLITSPTYDGVISDVRGIAQEVHTRGGILIVDEAHGAHFGLSERVPESAVTQGADLVIQSVHKTLPALTQTALLHRCSERVSGDLLRRFLGIYQTSSPSYVLMSSIDQCITIMERQGRALLAQLYDRLDAFYQSISDLQHLRVLRMDDPSKIIIVTEHVGLSGNMICDILRSEYHLEMEMSAAAYVLALCGLGDTCEGFTRLADALHAVDHRIETGSIPCQPQKNALHQLSEPTLPPSVCMNIHEAWDAETETIPLGLSAGKVLAEFVYLYPPGIPLLVPGEVMEEGMQRKLLALQQAGYSLQGMADHSGQTVQAVIHKLHV